MKASLVLTLLLVAAAASATISAESPILKGARSIYGDAAKCVVDKIVDLAQGGGDPCQMLTKDFYDPCLPAELKPLLEGAQFAAMIETIRKALQSKGYVC